MSSAELQEGDDRIPAQLGRDVGPDAAAFIQSGLRQSALGLKKVIGSLAYCR